MSGTLLLEVLAPAHLAGLRAALASAGLPHDDLEADDCRFFRARLDDELVGYAGLQGDGPDRLLRSVWVRPDRRREGTGTALLAALERRAADDGCRTLHLLTMTASDFFARHGYRCAARDSAPEGIASSREFAALCPASATYHVKMLVEPS
ncbi:MAG: arsenic resistance N-acetyltransferase ArsN2 [Dokdonella sp.]|nr:GNAT family N-acetyltransferase [Dokdonella sp.]MCB1570174.1 GNAT family N-acetyltransferase [Xanthomonadales bacterium]MCB1575066.1 GNAT family N-acetyltransferase [Xanthomonadales bacterium]MCB1577366.1 GNAT family N-acetyltransferase [Xanthomonadales bacterium]